MSVDNLDAQSQSPSPDRKPDRTVPIVVTLALVGALGAGYIAPRTGTEPNSPLPVSPTNIPTAECPEGMGYGKDFKDKQGVGLCIEYTTNGGTRIATPTNHDALIQK